MQKCSTVLFIYEIQLQLKHLFKHLKFHISWDLSFIESYNFEYEYRTNTKIEESLGFRFWAWLWRWIFWIFPWVFQVLRVLSSFCLPKTQINHLEFDWAHNFSVKSHQVFEFRTTRPSTTINSLTIPSIFTSSICFWRKIQNISHLSIYDHYI